MEKDPGPAADSQKGEAAADLKTQGIVAVGASAGGLEALTAFLSTLQSDFPWPIVIAQHMDPTHVSQFAEILRRVSKLPVHDAKEGETLQGGVVYACPAAFEISIGTDRKVSFRKPVAGRPQRVDHLFASVAAAALDKAIAIVLSGTGSDGSFGALAVKQRGGFVIAESEETARQFGMPSAAIQSGAVDFTRPVGEIGPLLTRIIGGDIEADARPEVDDIREILDIVKTRRGTTFDDYRMATLRRRIRRRMTARGVTSIDAYVALLQKDSSEVDKLFDALLINVTEFFRDLESWQTLEARVIPSLVERYRAGHEIRIWCPGCASGEEAYSIAILLAEALDEDIDLTRIKIFATDLDADALSQARAGRYEPTRMTNVSAARLTRFFQRTSRGYEVSKILRRMVIFGIHDLARDPPIGRLDLLTCRNVLIYFDLPLQRRVFSAFHFALAPHGHLFLGASEALPREFAGFTSFDRPSRIYVRTPTTSKLPAVGAATEQNQIDHASRGPTTTFDRAGLVESILDGGNFLVLIFDPQGSIHFVNPYGASLLGGDMAAIKGRKFREVINASTSLNEALEQVIRGKRRSHVRGAHVSAQGRPLVVDVTFDPIRGEDGRPLVLMVAIDVTVAEQNRLEATDLTREHQETIDKLRQTNDGLQRTNEELATSNEELQSSNEELTTLNEEIQSTNEELETTNEELQSTNEELVAVNAELQRASSELSQLEGLVQMTLDATPDAIVTIDGEGTVTRWGRAASEFFNIRADQALGKNLFSLELQLESGLLRGLIAQALAGVADIISPPIRITDVGRPDRWITIMTRSVRLDAHGGKELILLFHDRTLEEKAQRSLAAESSRYRALLRGTKEAVLVVGRDGRVIDSTQSAMAILGVDLTQTDRRLWDLAVDPKDVLQLKGAVADLMDHVGDQTQPPAHSISVTLRDGRVVSMSFIGVETPGEPPLIIVTQER